jgi:hypothetical protein
MPFILINYMFEQNSERVRIYMKVGFRFMFTVCALHVYVYARIFMHISLTMWQMLYEPCTFTPPPPHPLNQ